MEGKCLTYDLKNIKNEKLIFKGIQHILLENGELACGTMNDQIHESMDMPEGNHICLKCMIESGTQKKPRRATLRNLINNTALALVNCKDVEQAKASINEVCLTLTEQFHDYGYICSMKVEKENGNDFSGRIEMVGLKYLYINFSFRGSRKSSFRLEAANRHYLTLTVNEALRCC